MEQNCPFGIIKESLNYLSKHFLIENNGLCLEFHCVVIAVVNVLQLTINHLTITDALSSFSCL